MKIIGHCGARGLAPENTLVGLEKGLKHQVDELEFDLRVTKDQIVILNHNSFITSPNGKQYKINRYSFKELRSYKPDLATFSEVLDSVGNKVPLYIEVKPKEPIEPIVKIIQEYMKKGKLTNFYLASKSQKTLLGLNKKLPKVPKIVIEPWSGVRAHIRARQLNAKILSMNQLWLWSGFIISVKRGGYSLYAYTLNDPIKAAKWQKYGLSGVITDYPDRFEKK